MKRSLLFILILSHSLLLWSQIVVTSTADTGAGSLREAITTANTNPGPDNILFDNALLNAVINFDASLTITSGNGDGTTIDGDIDGDNIPDITIQRSGTGYSGIVVNAANCVIANLNIQGFGASPRAAIELSGVSATDNSIIGNYIGTDLAGSSTGTANFRGVAVLLGASGNSIGDGSMAGQNVISNNTFGIYINGADNNTVIGNIIGLDITGSNILGNAGSGVEVISSDGTLIGINGNLRNVISGNNQEGISLGSSTNTVIVNNYIGLNSAGTVDLGNGREGIFIDATSTPTQVGDGTVGGRNVSSGNGNQGLEIASDNNSVIGNYFGLNAAGTAAIPNTSFGIWIAAGASGNTIGNGTVGGRNVISGNNSHGIQMSDGPNYLYGNYVGLDETGTADVGNSGIGVFVTGGTSSKIGDALAGYGNVISNNTNGIQINVSGIEVYGNTIGLNAARTAIMAK
jgi:parallel beta-helix repeat protein